MPRFTTSFLIASGSDIEYFDAAKRLAQDYGVKLAEVNYSGMAKTGEQVESDEELRKVFACNGRVFAESIYRFESSSGPYITIDRVPNLEKHPFDQINLSLNELSEAQQPLFVALAQKHFGTMAVDYIGDLLGPGAKAQFEAREIALSRLEKLAANLMNEMETARRQRETELDEREEQLKEAYRKREAALESAFNERKLQQDKRDEQLKVFQQTLDDASAKDKRRKDFQAIKSKFSEWAKEFTVTEGTLNERKAIRSTISWFLFAVFSIAAALTAPLLLGYAQDTYLMIARSAAWILFVSTSLFFIRWDNAWFQRLANEEFRLKRLELDVERANWMIETASEWKEDEKELPLELINRMSANLFVDGGQEDPVEHTGETLAKAIANASQIKLGPTGTEVQWGKRDLNKPT